MSRTVMQRLFEPPSIREMAPGTKVIVYSILLFWTAFVLFPIYWVFITKIFFCNTFGYNCLLGF